MVAALVQPMLSVHAGFFYVQIKVGAPVGKSRMAITGRWTAAVLINMAGLDAEYNGG